MNPAEIQAKLDALTYPPNHCYDFQTMQPKTPQSALRFPYLIPHIKPLIQGKTVLDIGCSKGFFSIYCAENGAKKVIAQDINPDFTNITAEVAQAKGIKNLTTSTKPLLSFEREGDIALVLGVAHYLTFESKLDWLYKLYYLGYDILLEFPFATNDPVLLRLRDKYPNDRMALMMPEPLKQKVDGLYTITHLGQTPGQGRTLYYLKKNHLPQERRNQIYGLRFGKSRHTTSIWLHHQSGIMKLTPKNLEGDNGAGYPQRWIRAQRILVKEFPGIVPQPYMIVLDGNNKREGHIETRLEGGDLRVGFKNLFTIQLYLMSLGLLQTDLHTSDVYGNHVLDHEAIEPLTPEAEQQFRLYIPRSWRPDNITGTKGLNPDALNQFLYLLTTMESLENIFTKSRDLQWIV